MDPLPNLVCQQCWATTKAFHELYEKSKEIQEQYLNAVVKDEPDPIDEYELSTANIVVEGKPIVDEIDSIKFESNLGIKAIEFQSVFLIIY